MSATRPEIKDDVVWFDRTAMRAHMYEFTKQPQCSVDELVDYLRSELQSGAGQVQAEEASVAAATAS